MNQTPLAPVQANPRVPHRALKIALVGHGRWGNQYARVFSQHDDVDFCAVAGRNLERAQSFANHFGIRAYDNIGDMLAQEQPDLVCLSLPNQAHFQPTLEVIEAGFPLLVEKPLVFELSEADRLLAEADKRDLFFAINFNHRYARTVEMAREAIFDGRVGEIVFATWRFEGNWIPKHPHMTLIESQCHGFDMLEYLCGPISSVMAEMTDKTGHGYRSVALSLQFANGAVGCLVGSYDSSFSYKDTHRLEINGTQGRVTVEDTVQRFTYQARGEESRTVWEAGFFNDHDRQFYRTLDNHIDVMLAAFRQAEEPPIHARCGRRALLLALAAIESFDSGRRIAVPVKSETGEENAST